MINLIFYSDQVIPENAAVDERLLTVLASNRLGRRIGYIPSGQEPDRRFFQERVAYYARLGLELPSFTIWMNLTPKPTKLRCLAVTRFICPVGILADFSAASSKAD
ncbi:hypothetical protein [Allorhizobium taibaishanense]|uniref:Uncharacterized protein n=1 Tax=Allorhizobium taibaishanense TaxID=887144 RepID=A0A7W6MTL7_9HYPH|nr:hypothetical protein [Allorhizobium taibaishanense]MBB4007234.1 hypothetical protein [Allorhizobium taibaishanense]